MAKIIENFDALSAFFGASIALFLAWINQRLELKNIKLLINGDLIHLQEVVSKLRTETEKLLLKFENRENLETHSADSFEDLYTDIYDSVSKTDLHKIYKNRLPELVQIYKTVLFLKGVTPVNVYSKYVESWDNHKSSELHKRENGTYCDTHIGFINIAKGQLNNNLESMDQLKRNINRSLKFKFIWLKPL
ncbi:MAG TPA: hypothetical protein VIT44_15300 [Cyclobacteriaceae bacterium]